MKDYQKKQNRKHYLKDPEYHKWRNREWRASNPELYSEQLEKEKAKLRDRRKTDPVYREELNTKSRERYHNSKLKNWPSILYRSAKQRAKKLDLPFTITIDDVIIPEICPVFETPLIFSSGKLSRNSASIDRIDPKMGYVPGNVQVLSYMANTMKSNATKTELQKFAKWITEVYGSEENNEE